MEDLIPFVTVLLAGALVVGIIEVVTHPSRQRGLQRSTEAFVSLAEMLDLAESKDSGKLELRGTRGIFTVNVSVEHFEHDGIVAEYLKLEIKTDQTNLNTVKRRAIEIEGLPPGYIEHDEGVLTWCSKHADHGQLSSELDLTRVVPSALTKLEALYTAWITSARNSGNLSIAAGRDGCGRLSIEPDDDDGSVSQ